MTLTDDDKKFIEEIRSLEQPSVNAVLTAATQWRHVQQSRECSLNEIRIAETDLMAALNEHFSTKMHIKQRERMYMQIKKNKVK